MSSSARVSATVGRRFISKLPFVRVAALVLLAVALAGCGGSGSGSGGGGGSSSLVTGLSHAKAQVEGSKVVADVTVREGGKAGTHLSLRWGLVDAVSGVRASDEERLAARYVTTGSVESHDVRISFAKPTPTDYLVHFALYAPDGSYLASKDSNVFTVR